MLIFISEWSINWALFQIFPLGITFPDHSVIGRKCLPLGIDFLRSHIVLLTICSSLLFGKTCRFLFNIEWLISYYHNFSHDWCRVPSHCHPLVVSCVPLSPISLSFIKSSCWLWRQGTAGLALWKWASTTYYLLRRLPQFSTSDPWVSSAAKSVLLFASQCYTVTCFGFPAPCVPQHLKRLTKTHTS